MSHGIRLLVHCKSGDTDLGMKNLTAGTEFEWKFKRTSLTERFTAATGVRKRAKNSMLISMCSEKTKHFFTDAITATVFGLLEMMVLKNLPEHYDERRHHWEPGWMDTNYV
ncbi:hypothetical protein ACOSQ2_003651 [Xanthoceras sorbifolium]